MISVDHFYKGGGEKDMFYCILKKGVKKTRPLFGTSKILEALNKYAFYLSDNTWGSKR